MTAATSSVRSRRVAALPADAPAATDKAALRRVVVINDDSVASGGAAQIALGSIALLRQRGVEVTLLTGDDGSNPELAGLGVEVVAMGGSHILDGNRGQAALRGLYDGRAGELLSRWIAANDCPGTIYHLHNWHKYLSPAVFPPLRAVAARLLVTAHDYFLACPNGGYYDYPRNRPCELQPMGLACLARQCDKRHVVHKVWRSARHLLRQRLFPVASSAATVLAVHDGMLPYLVRGGIPPERIEVLRNPVVPWRHERVLAESNREVLFVGRLEADKGIDLLCDACERAGAPLQVIGEGPLGAELAARYPQVRFRGRLDRAAIGRAAAMARMLVVPTRWRETFGLVVFEALGCGLPVILSDQVLIRDEIAREGCGLICSPDRVEDLAAAIRRLSADDELVAAFSRRAFERAPALILSPEAWADALIACYRRKL